MVPLLSLYPEAWHVSGVLARQLSPRMNFTSSSIGTGLSIRCCLARGQTSSSFSSGPSASEAMPRSSSLRVADAIVAIGVSVPAVAFRMPKPLTRRCLRVTRLERGGTPGCGYLGRGRFGAIQSVAAGGIAWLLVASAFAQTDEIQVYDATTNQPGRFSIQLHNNYTPIGRTQPDFEGGIVPNHTLNGVPEWAYGVTDWLELGAYLPLYSWTNTGHFLIDGETACRVCRAARPGAELFLRLSISNSASTLFTGSRPATRARSGRSSGSASDQLI